MGNRGTYNSPRKNTSFSWLGQKELRRTPFRTRLRALSQPLPETLKRAERRIPMRLGLILFEESHVSYSSTNRQHPPMVVTMSTIGRETGSLISRTTAYQLEKNDPEFPRRIRLPFKKRGSGWFWDDIRSYLELQAAKAEIDRHDRPLVKRLIRQRAERKIHDQQSSEVDQ